MAFFANPRWRNLAKSPQLIDDGERIFVRAKLHALAAVHHPRKVSAGAIRKYSLIGRVPRGKRQQR